MKATIYQKTFLSLAALALMSSAATVVRADDSVPPPPRGEEGRPPIRIQIESNVEQNREVRNTALVRVRTERENENEDASSTDRIEVRGPRDGEMERPRMASSTLLFKLGKGEKKPLIKKMLVNTFEIRKQALIRELTVALRNLDSISTRIDAQIVKAEASGRTVTDAKALLVTAKEKLAQAKIEVATFDSFQVASSSLSVNASSTAQVDLTKPRFIGDAAIKSVKDARDAFKRVVVALAHDMGFRTATSTTEIRETSTTTASTTSGN